MAESQDDLEEHTHQSVIRGHHIYKDIWSPYIGEHLTLHREDSKTHDRHAVYLMKDNCAVGHVPRELSRVFWYFFVMGGSLLYHPLRHRRIISYMLQLVYKCIIMYLHCIPCKL